MLQKYLSLRKAKSNKIKRFSEPLVKSSIKLDSFLNFSKINDDSLNSINSDNHNNIIVNVENIQKVKNKDSPLIENKKESLETEKKYHNHPYCIEDLNKILNKKKSALSEYILTNTSKEEILYNPNIKLSYYNFIYYFLNFQLLNHFYLFYILIGLYYYHFAI